MSPCQAWQSVQYSNMSRYKHSATTAVSPADAGSLSLLDMEHVSTYNINTAWQATHSHSLFNLTGLNLHIRTYLEGLTLLPPCEIRSTIDFQYCSLWDCSSLVLGSAGVVPIMVPAHTGDDQHTSPGSCTDNVTAAQEETRQSYLWDWSLYRGLPWLREKSRRLIGVRRPS